MPRPGIVGLRIEPRFQRADETLVAGLQGAACLQGRRQGGFVVGIERDRSRDGIDARRDGRHIAVDPVGRHARIGIRREQNAGGRRPAWRPDRHGRGAVARPPSIARRLAPPALACGPTKVASVTTSGNGSEEASRVATSAVPSSELLTNSSTSKGAHGPPSRRRCVASAFRHGTDPIDFVS